MPVKTEELLFLQNEPSLFHVFFFLLRTLHSSCYFLKAEMIPVFTRACSAPPGELIGTLSFGSNRKAPTTDVVAEAGGLSPCAAAFS